MYKEIQRQVTITSHVPVLKHLSVHISISVELQTSVLNLGGCVDACYARTTIIIHICSLLYNVY